MHNEDRELQIRLAELQADLEINLTAFFGFSAVPFAFIILFEELFFSPSTSDMVKTISVITIAGAVFFLLFVGYHFARRAEDARKQISELRKKYIW